MRNKEKIKTFESSNSSRNKYDVIIIGGGAAGMSAALWCDELGLSALLLEKSDELGGQLLWTHNAIENHLGIEAENGRELREIFVRQIKNRKFSQRLKAEIIRIDLENKNIFLENAESFSAKTLAIATGVSRRKLNINGEDFFKGRGLLDSGIRSRNSVKDKNVVIVGGGDAAIENALILAESASKVSIVHRRRQFRARSEFLEKAANHSKITFLTDTLIRQISGSEMIEAVEVEDLRTGEFCTIPADAVLIRIGVKPNTDFLSENLETDEEGYIKIDSQCRTNLKDVWAIGDVANPISPTVSSAIGMGAIAVKSIAARIKQ